MAAKKTRVRELQQRMQTKRTRVRDLEKKILSLQTKLEQVRELKRPSRDKLLAGFGRRIMILRQAAEMTQEELGDRCGITRASISNIEAGRSWVAIETLELLALALGVHRSELMQRW